MAENQIAPEGVSIEKATDCVGRRHHRPCYDFSSRLALAFSIEIQKSVNFVAGSKSQDVVSPIHPTQLKPPA
jgi:hypothetical protein